MSGSVSRAGSVKDYAGVSSRGDRLVSKLVAATNQGARGSISLAFTPASGKGTMTALNAVRALEDGEKVRALVMVRVLTKAGKMTGTSQTVRVQAPKSRPVVIDSLPELEKLLAAKAK